MINDHVVLYLTSVKVVEDTPNVVVDKVEEVVAEVRSTQLTTEHVLTLIVPYSQTQVGVEPPKRPWTPSYSVSTQGAGSVEAVPQPFPSTEAEETEVETTKYVNVARCSLHHTYDSIGQTLLV